MTWTYPWFIFASHELTRWFLFAWRGLTHGSWLHKMNSLVVSVCRPWTYPWFLFASPELTRGFCLHDVNFPVVSIYRTWTYQWFLFAWRDKESMLKGLLHFQQDIEPNTGDSDSNSCQSPSGDQTELKPPHFERRRTEASKTSCRAWVICGKEWRWWRNEGMDDGEVIIITMSTRAR